MTPAEALASYQRIMARVGETIYVKRGLTSTATTARVMNYDASQLVGPITQGDRKVIALVDTLTSLLPLTVIDKLIVRGKTLAIKAVDDSTRRVQGTLIALEIQAGG